MTAMNFAALCAGSAMLLLGAAAETVYVGTLDAELVARPEAAAAIVIEVPFGSECERVGAPQTEWSRVRCPGGEGFLRNEQLVAEAPSFEGEKAKARDKSMPLAERFVAAVKAATLRPMDPSPKFTLLNLWYEQQFADLAAERSAGAPPQLTLTLYCHGATAADTPLKCLQERELAFVQGDFAIVDVRDQSFVAAVARGASCGCGAAGSSSVMACSSGTSWKARARRSWPMLCAERSRRSASRLVRTLTLRFRRAKPRRRAASRGCGGRVTAVAHVPSRRAAVRSSQRVFSWYARRWLALSFSSAINHARTIMGTMRSQGRKRRAVAASGFPCRRAWR